MILPDTLNAEARAARFARITEAAMRERRERGEYGIGTLAEKWQHQIIKRYLSENPSDHEVKLEGTRYVSDVRVEREVFEVQTGSFAPMQKKIRHYLEHTDLTVTVVHPIPMRRTVCRIDPETREIGQPRRSPRIGRVQELLPKLYPLIGQLEEMNKGRLKFRVLMLEVQDFRFATEGKNGKARLGERFERIPTELREDRSFDCREDFRSLIPNDLAEVFTVKQFSAATKIKGRDAYSAVRVLAALGLIEATTLSNRKVMAFQRL